MLDISSNNLTYLQTKNILSLHFVKKYYSEYTEIHSIFKISMGFKSTLDNSFTMKLRFKQFIKFEYY